MGIYSLRNKVLNEEKDWSNDNVINIGVAFDEFGDPIFYTDNDLITILKENQQSTNTPNITLLSGEKQRVVINIVSNEINGRRLKHGPRIKFKAGKKLEDVGTRSLTFDHDKEGNTIPIVSIYPNQDKHKNKFKEDDDLLKKYMIKTAFSFIQSNPSLIEDYFLGECDFEDVLNYADEYNKFSNSKKKEYAKQIIEIK